MVRHGLTGSHPCPCCGAEVPGEAATYKICTVCRWEDDGQGDADADVMRAGSPNRMTLAAARAHFREHGSKYEPGDSRSP